MRLYCLFAAAIGWFAIALQYYLVLAQPEGPAAFHRTINFFSYFTILSNVLAALALTMAALRSPPRLGRFLARPGAATAIALYIGVTGLVYVLLLRHLWQPQGLQFAVDALLHYAMPVLFLLYWAVVVPKGHLPPRRAVDWLAFPLAFAIWSLVHGTLSDFYPYPFIDVAALGHARVLVNMAALTGGLFLLGLLFVAADRLIARWRGIAAG